MAVAGDDAWMGNPASRASRPMDRHLLEAYITACYEVEVDGHRLGLRVGEPAAALEQAWPAACYCLLSAWNPGSQPLPAATNQAADRDLAAALAARAPHPLRTHSSDGHGGWREEGWLAAGLELSLADALALRFGQAGILYWRRGQAVGLRLYRPPPPARPARPWLECVRSGLGPQR
jgi:hypothetical protein